MRLEGRLWPDAAIISGRERARGHSQAVTQHGQGRHRLEGRLSPDTIVVGG